jgi:hypothetical protein
MSLATAILFPLFGGLRSHALYRRISDIGAYLRTIEDHPGTHRLTGDWENFLGPRSKYLAKPAWDNPVFDLRCSSIGGVQKVPLEARTYRMECECQG